MEAWDWQSLNVENMAPRGRLLDVRVEQRYFSSTVGSKPLAGYFTLTARVFLDIM